VYIVRSTDKHQTNSIKREFAVYKAKDNTELYDELNQYVDPSGDGYFYYSIPDWLDAIRSRALVYFSVIVWEMDFVNYLIQKIKRKYSNNVDE
jgi:hypothetical protein